jgi:hypothetical protein
MHRNKNEVISTRHLVGPHHNLHADSTECTNNIASEVPSSSQNERMITRKILIMHYMKKNLSYSVAHLEFLPRQINMLVSLLS